jgi:hypothetical protein
MLRKVKKEKYGRYSISLSKEKKIMFNSLGDVLKFLDTHREGRSGPLFDWRKEVD